MVEKEIGRPRAVIFIPGLSDDGYGVVRRALPYWQSEGFFSIRYLMHWKNNESYEQKLERVLEYIQQLSANYTVSVIGISAGGLVAIEAINRLPDDVSGAVNICGNVNKANRKGPRFYMQRTVRSPSFHEAVATSERTFNEGIPDATLENIMTVHAWREKDELIPDGTVCVEGANNQELPFPCIEHLLAINYALNNHKFAPVIMKFLLER